MRKIILLLTLFHCFILNAQNKYLIKVGTAGAVNTTFKNDIILNGTASNRLGVWVNGDTIPVAGKELDSAFKIITQKAVAPTYIQPTTSISSSQSPGYYEIGTILSNTLSSTFVQNNAGALISTTYYKNNVAMGGNTDTYTLTSSLDYKVTKSYAQGDCIANNFGVIDCTGRINAGSITSSTISFLPAPKRYWGTSSLSSPTSAIVVTSNGGDNELSLQNNKSSFVVDVTGTNQYVYYAYPSSFGALTSIIVSGLESFGAFTQTTLSVTNAQGYTQSYYVYTSNNQFNNTTISFNSVN